MKKIAFLLMTLFAISANAQFKATKDGVKTVNGEKFYIVNIEGKTAQELYNAANAYIISTFKNPNAVANKQENSMINLHGVFPEAFLCKKVMGMGAYADVNMNIIMYFKDGKIRFDIPIINSMYFNDKNQVVFSGGMNIMGDGDINMFKKNGNPNKEYVIEEFNFFINKTIKNIVEYVKNQSNEDW